MLSMCPWRRLIRVECVCVGEKEWRKYPNMLVRKLRGFRHIESRTILRSRNGIYIVKKLPNDELSLSAYVAHVIKSPASCSPMIGGVRSRPLVTNKSPFDFGRHPTPKMSLLAFTELCLSFILPSSWSPNPVFSCCPVGRESGRRLRGLDTLQKSLRAFFFFLPSTSSLKTLKAAKEEVEQSIPNAPLTPSMSIRLAPDRAFERPPLSPAFARETVI